ncbi:MAG: C40 family peptidase [Planctomycetota bacterium]
MNTQMTFLRSQVVWVGFLASLLALCLVSDQGQANDSGPAIAAEPEVDSRLVALAKRVEPELAGREALLSHYVDYYRRSMVNDTRLVAFNVTALADGDGGVTLGGYCEFEESRQGVEGYLAAMGFDRIENEIEIVPSASLGEQRFAVVKVESTLSYASPDEGEVVTDCLLGEPLFLLSATAGHFLAHSGEGYLGYIRVADVERLSEAEFTQYLSGPTVVMKQDLEDEGVLLPTGGRLRLVSHSDGGVTAELPGAGEFGFADSYCEISREAAPWAPGVIEAASAMRGTPYLWGGKTAKGVDCSGLVQVAFAGSGVSVPRDADQQFNVGQLTATRWCRGGMRAGDTMYFINDYGKISHTAIYLGGDRYLHAQMPEVGVNSLDPADPTYLENRDLTFVFAKRFLD